MTVSVFGSAKGSTSSNTNGDVKGNANSDGKGNAKGNAKGKAKRSALHAKRSALHAEPVCSARMTKRNAGRQRGFSLLEMSVVLLIMGLLLGSLLQPFGATLAEKKRRQTEAQLYLIREAIVGYAAANHRLPCPLTDPGVPTGECTIEHGFVPTAALGIDGQFDDSGFLIDSWGAPVRYSVSSSDADGNGDPDFTTANEMQAVGIQLLQPDFEVCDDAGACDSLRANQVPVVIFSTGQQSSGSADESENLDADRRFVSRATDTVGEDQFDDIVVWLSENILYSRLIRAGVLP